MLNYATSAEAASADAVVTDAVLADAVLTDAVLANAVLRPLAGIGAGAFACDGSQVGIRSGQMAAAVVLPRIRWVDGAISEAHGSSAGTVLGGSVLGGTVLASTLPGFGSVGASATFPAGSAVAYPAPAQADSEQFQQTTRIHPVAEGGVGPHPAREPDPV
jgi:hypothetical protein